MPLVRIDMITGRDEPLRRAIADAVQEALVEAIGIPPDDRFQVITEHATSNMIFDPGYLGIARKDPIFIQIALRRGRSVDMKRALYRALVERLGAKANVRWEDVFVSLVENGLEDWSFGNGEAQYVK